jgi:hypothetical protein
LLQLHSAEDKLGSNQTVSTGFTMAPQAYIISRVADPIFALFIGLSAAALRINREEKEKGKTTSDILADARRYVHP